MAGRKSRGTKGEQRLARRQGGRPVPGGHGGKGEERPNNPGDGNPVPQKFVMPFGSTSNPSNPKAAACQPADGKRVALRTRAWDWSGSGKFDPLRRLRIWVARPHNTPHCAQPPTRQAQRSRPITAEVCGSSPRRPTKLDRSRCNANRLVVLPGTSLPTGSPRAPRRGHPSSISSRYGRVLRGSPYPHWQQHSTHRSSRPSLPARRG